MILPSIKQPYVILISTTGSQVPIWIPASTFVAPFFFFKSNTIIKTVSCQCNTKTQLVFVDCPCCHNPHLKHANWVWWEFLQFCVPILHRRKKKLQFIIWEKMDLGTLGNIPKFWERFPYKEMYITQQVEVSHWKTKNTHVERDVHNCAIEWRWKAHNCPSALNIEISSIEIDPKQLWMATPELQ